jgi:hypothetical protein
MLCTKTENHSSGCLSPPEKVLGANNDETGRDS